MTNLNQNGRSMIEMLGVLAIIGVLSVGGIAGYSKAMMKFKINKTIDQIAMTVTNIRTLYAQQRTYDGLASTNAYDMGVVDDAMANGAQTTGNNSLKNAFNGPVTITTGVSGSVGERDVKTTGSTPVYKGAFILTFGNLPREACVAIATNDWGSNYSSGLLGIKTAATTAAAADFACYVKGGRETNGTDTGMACSSDGPLSVASAATGCDCSSYACSVSLKYY